MQEELTDDLRTMLSANVTALEIWMANQKRIAAVLAEEPRLRNLAVELLNKGGAKATDQMALAILLARQLIIGDRLQARLSSLGYTVAQLVNTNFEVVLDSGRGAAAWARRWRKTCSRTMRAICFRRADHHHPLQMQAPESTAWPSRAA